MKEKEFCKIYTQFHGDGIDNVKQLVKQVYTGEELFEFCSFIEESILSRKELSDEEINEQFATLDRDYLMGKHMNYRTIFADGAKWARTKLTGK